MKSPLSFLPPSLSPLPSPPFLSSPPHSRAVGNEHDAANSSSTRNADTRKASPQSPRTNTVGGRLRGLQRTVRGGGQAAPIAWRSVPMTPISAQLPPHPPLVARLGQVL